MERDTDIAGNRRADIRRGLKLVVLGATGGTGLEIVKQALERGHWVTAFVRSRDRLRDFRDRIDIKHGDLLNSEELEQAIQGHEVVLSGFGPRVPVAKADANLLERFARALTTAMPQAGVRRVIVESVAFLFKDSIFPPATCWADCSFQEPSLTLRRWSECFGTPTWIGPWCARRN